MPNITKNVKRLFRYLLPVIIVLLVFVFVSQITLSLTQREAKETSTKISKYFVQNIESSLSNLQRLTYELLSTRQAEMLQYVDPAHAMDAWVQSEAIDLGNELYKTCMAYDLISDVVIYYPELDVTVSRHNYLSTFKYLHLYHHDLAMGSQEYQTLHDLFFSHNSNRFVVERNPISGKTEMFFVRKISDSTSNERMLIMRLDTNEISALMQELLQGTSLQYIAMITEEGQICASAGSVEKQNFSTVQQLEEALDNHIYIRTESSTWNAEFCFVQSNSEAYHFANVLFTISVIAVVISAVLGLYLAIIIYRKDSHKEKMLLENLPFEIQEHEDVYSAINDKLNKIYEENVELIDQMEQQRYMVDSAFLKELLNMQNTSHIEVDHLCTIYDTTLENDCFAMFFAIPKSSTTANTKDQILSLIRQVGTDDFSVLWTKIDRIDVLLCNFETNANNGITLTDFQKLLDEHLPQHRIYQLPQLLFTVAAIPEYFRSQYVQIIRGGRPISVKNPVDEKQLTLRMFLEAIQQMQWEEAIKMLPDLSSAISQLSQSNEGLCQMHAMLGSLYKVSAMQPYIKELDSLFSDTTGKSWSATLETVFRGAGKNTDIDSDSQSTVEQAYQIILKEYDNAQLSLSLLAERLEVNQSYLSRAFKQRYHENVLHFLNRIRVDHAKEYLLQTNDSINTIALRVGFLSDMNLIRVFKKLEDETPGNFRKRKVL